MKQTNYRFPRKRNLWRARLEVLSRRLDHWLDENHETVFYGFVMCCLFALQFLLFLL